MCVGPAEADGPNVRMHIMKRKNKGFTLVEIMIVVAIIALLATIAIPSFMKARTSAQSGACVNNLRQIMYAKEQYAFANSNQISANLGDYVGTNAYIKSTPVCPGGGTYTVGALTVNPTCSVGTPHVLPN